MIREGIKFRIYNWIYSSSKRFLWTGIKTRKFLVGWFFFRKGNWTTEGTILNFCVRTGSKGIRYLATLKSSFRGCLLQKEDIIDSASSLSLSLSLLLSYKATRWSSVVFKFTSVVIILFSSRFIIDRARISRGEENYWNNLITKRASCG